jgi:RNA polymerase sigma-70 factor (ECF subfamily)
MKTMTSSATLTIQKTESLTILQRVANKDRTAVKDYIDTYGNFIWALAKKITASTEEAEAASQEIFTDIWRYSERTDKTQSVEEKLIAMIALRRLIKRLQ